MQDPHPPAQPGVAGPGALAAVREAREARAHQALQARLRDLEQLLPGLPNVRARLRASPMHRGPFPALSRRAFPGCAGSADTLSSAASASRRVRSRLPGLPAMRAWLTGSFFPVSGCQRVLSQLQARSPNGVSRRVRSTCDQNGFHSLSVPRRRA